MRPRSKSQMDVEEVDFEQMDLKAVFSSPTQLIKAANKRMYSLLLARLDPSLTHTKKTTARTATNSGSPRKPVETSKVATDRKDGREIEAQSDMDKKNIPIAPHVGAAKNKVTKPKSKKAAPKQKKRQPQEQQTYKVEHINTIRRAHDYTPDKKRWQFAVKWVGYETRSWHTAETLNNYPLLCEHLATAIDANTIRKSPQQEQDEDEGADVDESMVLEGDTMVLEGDTMVDAAELGEPPEE